MDVTKAFNFMQLSRLLGSVLINLLSWPFLKVLMALFIYRLSQGQKQSSHGIFLQLLNFHFMQEAN